MGHSLVHSFCGNHGWILWVTNCLSWSWRSLRRRRIFFLLSSVVGYSSGLPVSYERRRFCSVPVHFLMVLHCAFPYKLLSAAREYDVSTCCFAILETAKRIPQQIVVLFHRDPTIAQLHQTWPLVSLFRKRQQKVFTDHVHQIPSSYQRLVSFNKFKRTEPVFENLKRTFPSLCEWTLCCNAVEWRLIVRTPTLCPLAQTLIYVLVGEIGWERNLGWRHVYILGNSASYWLPARI